MPADQPIRQITRDRFDEAVAVLCDAFFDYPVMRFVIGDAGEDYARRLTRLIGFFTEVRFLRDDIVLALAEDDRFLGVANLNRPSDDPLLDSRLSVTEPAQPWPHPADQEVDEVRQALWADLGAAARARYESYGEATAHFVYPDPHFHLGMIGVLASHGGKGLGGRILDHVHALSHAHPASVGVSLTTENPANVPLYEHFGYGLVGHQRVADIETWGLFRRDPESQPSTGHPGR